MIRTIAKIFGSSPFDPFQIHMDKVSACVEKGKETLNKFYKEDFDSLEEQLTQVSHLEHEADIAKIEIRTSLPNSIFLPISRADLLEILSLQDNLADTVENMAVVISLKPLKIIQDFLPELQKFANKNFEAFDQVRLIIYELSQLARSSFGGMEAQKVKLMIDNIAFIEHEADILQRKILKKIFNHEGNISARDFHIWMRLLQGIGSLSDISDKLAHRILISLQPT